MKPELFYIFRNNKPTCFLIVFILFFFLSLNLSLALSLNIGRVSVFSSTIERKYTFYPETCIEKGEIFLQMQFVVVEGKFGIKSVKINGNPVTVVERKDGECKGWECTSATFKGTFPISVVKNGENLITIEYFTPCTDDPIKYLTCSASEQAPGIFNTINGYIDGVRGTSDRWQIELTPQTLTFDTSYCVLRTKVGKKFSFKPKIMLVGIRESAFDEECWQYYGHEEEFFDCFKGDINIPWKIEFEGSTVKSSNENGATLTAPPIITIEAAKEFGHGVEVYSIPDVSKDEDWLYYASYLGGCYPLKFHSESVSVNNVRVKEDCIFWLIEYLMPQYEYKSYYSFKCADLKIEPKSERRWICVFPYKFKPKFDIEIVPKRIKVYPPECTSSLTCNQEEYPFPLKIKIKGRILVGEDTLDKPYFIKIMKIVEKNVMIPIPPYWVESKNGEFSFEYTPSASELESYEPIQIQLEGPYYKKIDYCRGLYYPTGSCKIITFKGKSIYIEPTTYTLTIPREGECNIEITPTSTFEEKEKGFECQINLKLSPEECDENTWKVERGGKTLCEGRFPSDTECNINLEFEEKSARIIELNLTSSSFFKSFEVLCGNPDWGIYLGKYECPVSACQKINEEYLCKINECKKVVK